MNPSIPQAPSTTGLARPAAPTGATPISPSGAPGLPALPQGTIAPTVSQTAPSQFNTGGALDAIANYYQIPRQTALAAAGVEGNKFNATTAYEGKLQEESQFAKEQLDPSAYKIQQTPNGLRILDPVTGQQIDTNTFSNRTGSEGINMLVSAAAKSPNPRDQQFASDYQNFQEYMNASINAKFDSKGNPMNEEAKLVQSYQANNKSLQNLTPQQAAQLFNSEYGDYLGVGQTGQTPSSAQFTPELSQQLLNYLFEHNVLYGSTPQGGPPNLQSLFNNGTLSSVGGSTTSQGGIGPPSL